MKDKFPLIFLVVLFSILLLSVNTKAEKIYLVDFTITKNNSIEEFSLEYTNGTVRLPKSGRKYNLTLLTFSGTPIYRYEFGVTFGYFSDPGGFKQVNKTHVYLRIPYRETASFLKISGKGGKIFIADIHKEVCNRNEICEREKGESRFNCIDCVKKAKGKEEVNYYYYLIFPIIAVLLVGIYYSIK